MNFDYDRASKSWFDATRGYVVVVEGDRYGTVFHVRVADTGSLRIWAKRTERAPHETELRSRSYANAHTLIVWVVDNRAGTGASLLTLEDRLGEHCLGEVLCAFLSSYETARNPDWDPASKPLKIECRGNQRFDMEERYGP